MGQLKDRLNQVGHQEGMVEDHEGHLQQIVDDMEEELHLVIVDK